MEGIGWCGLDRKSPPKSTTCTFISPHDGRTYRGINEHPHTKMSMSKPCPYLRRAELSAAALVDGHLDLPLQRGRVGVVRHVDGRGPLGVFWGDAGVHGLFEGGGSTFTETHAHAYIHTLSTNKKKKSQTRTGACRRPCPGPAGTPTGSTSCLVGM